MLIFYSIFPSKFLLVFNLTVGKFMGVGKLGNRIDRATIRYYTVHLKKLRCENLVLFYRSEDLVFVKTKTLYYLKS